MRRICHCTIYYTKKYNSDTYQENLQKIQVMKRVPSIFVTFCSIAILMMISTPSWGGGLQVDGRRQCEVKSMKITIVFWSTGKLVNHETVDLQQLL